MEELGQDYGFTLYEHEVTKVMSGLLQPGDRPRDRVIVYVNEARIGVIDSICTSKIASFVVAWERALTTLPPPSPFSCTNKKTRAWCWLPDKWLTEQRPVPDEYHFGC